MRGSNLDHLLVHRECSVCSDAYVELGQGSGLQESDYRCRDCFLTQLAIPLECLFDIEFLRDERSKWLRQRAS
jgi:hypothetical protein